MKIVELLKMAYSGVEQPQNFDELRAAALLEFEEETNKRLAISPNGRYYRNRDPRNYQLVKLVRRRDGNKCLQCGRDDNQTTYEVSHILPVELFPEYAFEEWNARMECHDCNHKVPGSLRAAWKRSQRPKNILKIIDEVFRDK